MSIDRNQRPSEASGESKPSATELMEAAPADSTEQPSTVRPQAGSGEPPNRLNTVVLIMSLGYMAIVSAFMASRGHFAVPDTLFVVGMAAALVAQRLGQFVKDWTAPILLLIAYDYLRGAIPDLSAVANTQPMIWFDKTIFGEVPSVLLQRWLYHPGVPQWYDRVAATVYLSHFAIPMVVGFWLWMKNRTLYRRYIVTILIVSYLAFLTYYLFPAVPPWMAAERGLIPPLAAVNIDTILSFIRPLNIPTMYEFAGYNPVAAVPSLHAAYPLIVFLFVRRLTKWGWLLVPYPLIVWTAIVYSADHYVFDITASVVYVSVIYTAMLWWEKRASHKQWTLGYATSFFRRDP